VAAAGPDETAYHLRATGWPIISLLEVPSIPGAVVRPFTDPIPFYPWTMVYRRNLEHPALAALDQAIDELAAAYAIGDLLGGRRHPAPGPGSGWWGP